VEKLTFGGVPIEFDQESYETQQNYFGINNGQYDSGTGLIAPWSGGTYPNSGGIQPNPFPYTYHQIQGQQIQQQQQMNYWKNMLGNAYPPQPDPREVELSLLKEIRARAQFYAMILLSEMGLAA